MTYPSTLEHCGIQTLYAGGHCTVHVLEMLRKLFSTWLGFLSRHRADAARDHHFSVLARGVLMPFVGKPGESNSRSLDSWLEAGMLRPFS